MYNHPCKKGCQNRAVGCHGTCPEYKEFRAEREEAYKGRSQHYEACDYTSKAIEKNRRSRKR